MDKQNSREAIEELQGYVIRHEREIKELISLMSKQTEALDKLVDVVEEMQRKAQLLNMRLREQHI